MIPIRIYLEGFMCYREPAELNFEGASLWMLTGKNGAGKSGVFDAITYVLYGFHRFGKKEHGELINKNSPSLTVEFDFAVGNDLYRVKRTCQRRKNSPASTFLAWEFRGGYGATADYEKHLQIVTGTDKKEGFEEWVIKTIGLDAQAFAAAVLLQQGKADQLLKADPKDRHPILAQIVDLSKYESLHERADKLRANYRQKAELLEKQLLNLQPVEPAQIEKLKQEIETATLESETANETLEKLIELKVHAANWGKLIAEQSNLNRQIKTAEKLFENETAIENEAAEAAELNQIFPVLKSLFADRERLNDLTIKQREHAELESRIADLQTILSEIELTRQAFPFWQRYCEERQRWRLAKVEIEKLETDLQNLEDGFLSLETAEAEQREILDEAERRRDDAKEKLTRAKQKYDDAVGKNERFSKLEGHGKCDWCGQTLTAEHRIAESAKLEKSLREAETTRNDADEIFKRADNEHETQKAEFDEIIKSLENSCREKERVELNLKSIRDEKKRAEKIAAQNLSELPEKAKNQFESSEDIYFCFAQEFPTDEDLSEMKSQSHLYVKQHKELEDLGKEHNKIAAFLGQLDAVKTSIERQESLLSEQWREKSQTLNETDLRNLQARKDALIAAPQKMSELQQAKSEQNLRQTRLASVIAEIEATDEQARRPAAEIEIEISELRRQKDAAEANRRKAETEKLNLENLQLRREELEKDWQESQHKFALYKKLAELLGRDFLQRQLLRDAETTIVTHANRFLDRVSSGTLRLELKTETTEENAGAKGTKALDLVAYHEAAGADALPVDALSGGQRFRVAVSLALGIGQYANAGTRRLESVIIDEGFGSLDREGRTEMIAELRGLQNEMRRVIVVSHQEEVADAFPNNKYLIEYLNGSSQVRLVDN